MVAAKIAAGMAALLALQTVPVVGAAIDTAILFMLAWTIGWEAGTCIDALVRATITAVNAKDEADLDRAARLYADAFKAMGTAAVSAVTARFMLRARATAPVKTEAAATQTEAAASKTRPPPQPPAPPPPPSTTPPKPKATQSSSTMRGSEKAADSEVLAGSGGSLRLKYMGGTPDKFSRTGADVVDRMRSQGLIVGDGPLLRSNPNNLQLVSDGQLIRIDHTIDMAHQIDAVSWWNQSGRFFGAKSPEVRAFMLNSDNYILQPSSINRAAGARIGETYQPPVSPDFSILKR